MRLQNVQKAKHGKKETLSQKFEGLKEVVSAIKILPTPFANICGSPWNPSLDYAQTPERLIFWIFSVRQSGLEVCTVQEF